MQFEYKRDVNWKKDLDIGSKQESKFEVFMKSFGYVCEDLSDVKEYQDIDCDFKVTNTKGVTNLFEVKQDKTLAKHDYVRRRLIIEDISSVKDRYGNVVNTNGWYRKCKADYLIISNGDSKMYMYRLEDIKAYIDLYYGKDDSRVCYYPLGNSIMFGIYQKKFDKWLIDNNKICKVFYLDSNKCISRKDVK